MKFRLIRPFRFKQDDGKSRSFTTDLSVWAIRLQCIWEALFINKSFMSSDPVATAFVFFDGSECTEMQSNAFRADGRQLFGQCAM
ncbi:hypothetical protein CEXT_540101 [Caerostris extrusa]|uniref:Uncharacterized protein n=1 Tax=Caerostris extrusa TaxID=172846 RepID=A0AAV4T6V8_CAEEX|nr:hypothetical protein CEXT_540101 [Caerostris extrusa]